MQALRLHETRLLSEQLAPLTLESLPDPVPGDGEILLRVLACGVCHTELDEIEGRLTPPRLPIVPGHEVVGEVIAAGDGVTAHQVGDRVGVGWIHSSTGGPDENLSPQFRATGLDANGGYAELMTAPAGYAYPIPNNIPDEQAAPLLCAGAVGFRALRLTRLDNGNPLGLTGFGGSGHLVLPMARRLYPNSPIYVFARSEETRQFAREQGADWAGDTHDEPPQPPQAIIDTTPAWTPVVAALRCLRPGGRLVINAIRKEDTDKEALLDLSYHEHLWREREIKSVANVTAGDIRECLQIAGEIGLSPTVEVYPWQDANRALVALKRGPVRGAKVLMFR